MRVTTRDQRVTWVSPGLADGIGLHGQDLVGRPIFEILDSVWTPAMRDQFASVAPGPPSETPEHVIVRVLSSDPSPGCFELRTTRLAGSEPESILAELIPVTATSTPVEDDVTDHGTWQDHASFARELRTGITSGDISVVYEPIFELVSGAVLMVEATLQWTHAERGDVPWTTLVPLAERFGLTDEVAEWSMRVACADVASMESVGLSVDLAVNLSIVQLGRAGTVDRISETLAATGLSSERLWVEVTEAVLLDEQALAPLRRLHDRGIHLAIGGYGAGIATFQDLARLPVDALKIDATYVRGLGTDANDGAVARTVINTGRDLGLAVIAEGVDTEVQRGALTSLHGRLGQGALSGRGLSATELIRRHGPADSSARGVPRAFVDAEVAESERLAALRACQLMDTPSDVAFDDLAELAAQLLGTPMALVTFIDADRQWFKARIGVDITETSRDNPLCTHALRRPRSPFIVRDTHLDSHFVDDSVVVGAQMVRSYAGVPILSRESLPIGTLCVLDTVVREFTDDHIRQLSMLAEQVAALSDLRRRSIELGRLLHGDRDTSPPNVSTGVPQTTTVAASAVGRAIAYLTEAKQLGAVRAVKRPATLRFGALDIDVSTRRVHISGVPIDMTMKEFDLLVHLAERPGVVCSRNELLRDVWQSQSSWQDPATVTEHIYRLRSKLEDDPANPRLITTVRGVGYRIDPLASVEGRSVDLAIASSDGGLPTPGIEHASSHDVSVAVIVTDPALRILSWNSAAQTLYGWTEEEVLGRSVDSVVPVHDGFDQTTALADLAAAGHWQQPVRQRTRDGTDVTVLASVRLLRNDDGEVTAVVAVNRPLVEVTRDLAVDVAVGSVDRDEVLRALHRREFVVYYEPIVRLADRELIAVRTRPRWLRPDGGIWDLSAFVGALERADVLDELMDFVCSAAVAQVERWSDAGRAVGLAIELRSSQLDHPPLVAALAAASERLMGHGARLWLEIEQREVSTITAVGVGSLERLAAVGALLSIRGFGVDGIGVVTADGQTIRIDALKVDASLIVGVDDEIRISEFVTSIIAMATSLDIPVGVGGVESEIQHTALVSVGCLVGQGPLYGEPTLGDHVTGDFG